MWLKEEIRAAYLYYPVIGRGRYEYYILSRWYLPPQPRQFFSPLPTPHPCLSSPTDISSKSFQPLSILLSSSPIPCHNNCVTLTFSLSQLFPFTITLSVYMHFSLLSHSLSKQLHLSIILMSFTAPFFVSFSHPAYFHNNCLPTHATHSS